MQLLKSIVRLLCTGSHRSTVPTGFVPLTEIRSALVFTDPAEQGCEEAVTAARKFFEDKGIDVSFISAADRDIRRSADLFVSLCGRKSISERYAAAACTARFKVGRHQIDRQLYDVTVTDGSSQPASGPIEAFRAIAGILSSVK